MDLYLYDPRTNVSKRTTYKELMGITGLTMSSLSKAKTNGSRIRVINCYLSEGIAPLKRRRKWYASVKHPDEAWMPVEGTNGQYLVSNYGRVRKVYKTLERLKLPYQKKGEGNLWVKVNGEEVKVAHLVADAFLRKRKPNERVVRKNGIVTDDYVGNLEIISLRELGRRTGYMAKSMPVVQIDAETMKLVNEYRSAREAARNYFLSYQAILDRCHGIHSQSDGYIWMFLDDFEKQQVAN